MLTALRSFRLYQNDLSWDIPHSLDALTMLRQLYIAAGNRLTGCLPAALVHGPGGGAVLATQYRQRRRAGRAAVVRAG